METPLTTTLPLPQELTIYTAAATRDRMLEWLAAQPAADDAPLAADGGAVLEVDGAGVQLLLALANGVAARGRSFVVAPASESLRSACAALGADALVARTATQGARA
jgi:anti-anti-sigma regulatory factor